MGLENYDCKNAIEPLIDNSTYLEEYELAKESFESAKILFENNKFKDAYIILFVGLQNLGQAVLIYKFKSRTKSKMCQFKYLNEKGLISKADFKLISELNQKRNDVYYNNPKLNSQMDKEIYLENYTKIMTIVKKLEGLL